jgi:chromosome segregation ATPase
MALAPSDHGVEQRLLEEHRRIAALDSELREARSLLAKAQLMKCSSVRPKRPSGVRLHADIAQPIVEARDRLLALQRETAALTDQRATAQTTLEAARERHSVLTDLAAQTKQQLDDQVNQNPFFSNDTATQLKQEIAVKKAELEAVELVVRAQLAALVTLNEQNVNSLALKKEFASLNMYAENLDAEKELLTAELEFKYRAFDNKTRALQNIRIANASNDTVAIEGARCGIPLQRAAQLEWEKVAATQKLHRALAEFSSVEAAMRTRALTLQQLTQRLAQTGAALTVLKRMDGDAAPVVAVRTQALATLQTRLQELESHRVELDAALEARDAALEDVLVKHTVLESATNVSRVVGARTLQLHAHRLCEIEAVSGAQAEAADVLLLGERERMERLRTQPL